MKIIFFIFIAILSSAICFCQDTINKLQNWSISTSLNIIYPNTEKFYIESNSDYNNVYRFDVFPQWSVSPRVIINYERLIFKSRKTSYTFVTGVGYSQYTYKGVENIIYDFNPSGFSETRKYKEKANYIEMNLGMSFNFMITKNVIWNNQILFQNNLAFYIKQGNMNIVATLQDSRNFLYYQTGFKICLNKNLSLTPTIAFSIVEISNKYESYYFNKSMYEHYNNIIVGLIFTYTNSKMQ